MLTKLLNLRRVGGLTHWRVGRLGGTFHVKRKGYSGRGSTEYSAVRMGRRSKVHRAQALDLPREAWTSTGWQPRA